MPRKVLIALIKSESNGFSKMTTPLSAFGSQNRILRGPEMIERYRGTNLEPGGFIEVAEAEGWQLVPSIAAFASSSGPVEGAALEALCDMLIEDLTAAMPVDGVLLALHGSMMSETCMDTEREIVRRVRAVVGPTVPVLVSLDPHCNISHEMAADVQGMYAFRTSPHVDQRRTGIVTARMLAENFRRGALSRCVLARRRMLIGFDGARTYHDHGPFHEAIALAKTFEADPEILRVSIHAGYSKADCPMVGPSAAVTGFAPEEKLREVAETMMDECWRTRNETSEAVVSMEAARRALAERRPGDRPVVLGDYGDAPGGGAHGDGTALLSLLLETGAKNAVVVPMYDPEAALAFYTAGEGATLTLPLGGKYDPVRGGGPVERDWTVKRISDGKFAFTGPYGTGTRGSFGESALIESDGVMVIVTSLHRSVYDKEQLRIYGIEPEKMDVLVIKTMQGHRADFQPIAGVCLDVDSGGITSPDPLLFDWKHVPRPIWPMDAEVTG
ncbi:microcystinase C [Primorskyibacter flagellatus]|uniref:Microcystinase C n=1 Tax=Primorskyibacter flagellatus TaxID=1387277 RepID=A0A917AGY2_9RHOB|nr:M81 family metallopeptidase [Primorskyibacter flagellatus]GGE50260.1 microcystinase C [Primorskyibacter flagellatus]